MTLLTVVANDRGTTVDETGQITIGRSTLATIKLDADRADGALSRLCGLFTSVDGQWQIVNTATNTRLNVVIDGGLRAELAPGAAPLTLPTPSTGQIHIQTARSYVAHITITGGTAPLQLPELSTETTTITVASVLELTDNERLLLVALAEPRLRNPDAGAWTVATTAQLQTRLNIKAKQIEDLIDSITAKCAPYVTGLIGTNSGRAVTRRHQIVDFALRSGCIDRSDLPKLASP